MKRRVGPMVAMLVACGGIFSVARTHRVHVAVAFPKAVPTTASGIHRDLQVVPPTATARAQPLPTAVPNRVGVQAPVPAKAKYMVLMVIDGGRPSYLDVPGIPHVKALIDSGTRYNNAWAGILESETPSGHVSITTGSVPRSDGILSFGWANSDNLPINLFDPNKINKGDMERIIAGTHVPTIAGLVHQQDPTAKVVALSGHKYYAADAIGGPNADVIMYYNGTKDGKYGPVAVPGHVPPQSLLAEPDLTLPTTHLPVGAENRLAMELAARSFEKLHQKVTLINLPEFDWPLGHLWGADSDPTDVRKMMQDFDSDLGKLEDVYRKAGVLDQTLFVITADHGFAPIAHNVDHNSLTKAVTGAGTSIVSDSYHTASYIWVKDKSRAAQAAANISALQNPFIQSVYFKEPLAGGYEYVRATGDQLFRAPGMEAANQYLLGSFIGPNGPDIVVQFTQGAASLPGGEASWKGDHGGADWNSQHLPLVFSGPGVRSHKVSLHPARLIDIAPTALTLMGITPTGMQGIALADATIHPPDAAVVAQRAQKDVLLPLVDALAQESRREVAAGL